MPPDDQPAAGSPEPTSLDHVALWVSDPSALADLLCRGLGMHLIESTDSFTLVGVDALLGKLTLFAAEGPRQPGALDGVVLRVPDVEQAARTLPDGLTALDVSAEAARVQAPDGLTLGLVRGTAGHVPYDLDHVVLRVGDPPAAERRLRQLGFSGEDGRLVVGDRHLRLVPGDPGSTERPLLNHLALLVDSVEAYLDSGRERDIEVDEIKDAANTYAAFVWGPERIKLEYVEHKPGFSLV